ncbi:hypothetical protein BAE44_0017848 [Dichanthelium oligosanthes]|uniref:Uncharacterized protein n=1 Tax=Dichanthelium oligosanthes TaxID=888268 RepID=A0A1E5V7X9_9POAL|nr:hypothetical protein BAE44_0017848 [Dichanthelium oligosanthes]
MASMSGELRMTLMCVALLGLLLLSQHAAPVDATGAAATGKKTTSFSFNNAGGRTLSSFSMNAADKERKTGGKGV